MDIQQIHLFHEWFAINESRLRRLSREQAFITIQTRIERIDRRLTVEVNLDPETPELILSANGHRDLFGTVKAMAAKMAETGWLVVPLKPARGFDFVLDVSGVSVDAENLRFKALRHIRDPHKFGVCVGVISGIETEKVASVARIILETGIGEELTAELDAIDAIDLKPPDFSNWLPIAALQEHVLSKLRDRGK